MHLTGISNRGLAVITLLVAILWGCIFAERAIIRNAREQTDLLLHSRRMVPVKYEQPRFNKRGRTSLYPG